MAFDWTPPRGARKASPFKELQPDRVLYDLDGPIIFTVSDDEDQLLFFKSDEDVEGDNALFFAVVTNDSIVNSLASGSLSLRTALSQAKTWVMECDPNLKIEDCWHLSSNKIPEPLLPQTGYGLSAKHGIIKERPDRTAAPFLSIHFENKKKAVQRTLPLSVFVKLVNEVAYSTFEIFRPAIAGLTPDLSDKARRKMLAIPVYEPSFGSLLIEMEQPRINRSHTKLNADIDDRRAEAEFLKANSEFLEDVKGITERARINKLVAKDSGTIELLAQLVPTEKSYFDKITIEGWGVGKQKTSLTIDLESGQRIWDEFSSSDGRKRKQVGKIVEISDRSSSFILEKFNGREVTCVATLATTMKLFKSLQRGMKVAVEGTFEKRNRRDKLYVEGLEILPR